MEKSTSKVILGSSHYTEPKTRRGLNQNKELQTNLFNGYRYKIPQQDTAKQIAINYQKHHVMTK